MQRETTKSATIAAHWVAEGYHVHAMRRAAGDSWIKGSRRYSEIEQAEARAAIAALCAQICEVA
jgi:hypothetical protein